MFDYPRKKTNFNKLLNEEQEMEFEYYPNPDVNTRIKPNKEAKKCIRS